MAAKICEANHQSFSSTQTLYRRLNKLRKAGLIQRDRMLFNGEFYYHLTRKGASFVESHHGVPVPSRACSPVGLNVQAHEFALSQFWIKFLSDCRKLNVPILDFQRDGQCVFRMNGKRLIPDSLVILKIRGKHRAFFLEMDRSTQTSGFGGKEKSVIHQKLLNYRSLSRSFRTYSEFEAVYSIRVIFVCLTESRLHNLRTVAENIGLKGGVCFTTLPRFIDSPIENSANGWHYKRANFLAAPLFSFPIRPPPSSLLS